MMPKPNPNKNNNKHAHDFGNNANRVLLETKPSFWLYSDNFILKIIVLFLLVLMFAPILTFVYTLHSELVENFHIAIDNVMFYSELILLLLVLVVLIKIILDVLDWNYTSYVFTESSIIIQRGFIHKEKIIMSYSKIQDIEIRQSLLERILRVGDIIIYGANEVSETVLFDIPSPKKVEEIILSKLNSMGFNQNTMNTNMYNPNYHGNMQYNPMNNPQYQQGNIPQYQQVRFENTNIPDYDEDPETITPEHNQQGINNQNQQEYPNQNNQYMDNSVNEYEDVHWDSKTMDRKEVLRKHDQMFKRHKK